MYRLILVGLVAVPVFAAAPPFRLDGREVTRLIAQLGDRDFDRRHAAHRQLAACGPEVLPALLAGMKTSDLEVRRRLISLIAPLEREREFRPKRITATFKNTPLDKVFAEIRTQTGLRLHPIQEEAAAVPRTFTGAFHHATFWEVMDAIGTTNKLIPTMVSDEKNRAGLTLRPVKRQPRFISREGAFQVGIHQLQQSRNLDLDDGENDEMPPILQLQMSVAVEPRFEFVHVGEPRVEVARDERGRSLLPILPTPMVGENEGVVFLPAEEPTTNQGTPYTNTTLLLHRHHTETARISLLRGTVPTLVITGHTIRPLVPRFTKGTILDLGTHRFEIGEIKSVKKRQEIRLHYKPPAGAMGEPEGFDPGLFGRLEFRDSDGNPCRCQMQDQLAGDVFLLRVTYSRKAGKPATTILLKEPTIRSMDIPFEFRDVPLP